MAHVAKDGSKHTNIDSMKRADAKHSMAPVAHEPEPDPQDPAEPQEGEGEMSSDDILNAFEQHMQAHMAGAQPDPHNAKRLADHFSKYVGQSNGQ